MWSMAGRSQIGNYFSWPSGRDVGMPDYKRDQELFFERYRNLEISVKPKNGNGDSKNW